MRLLIDDPQVFAGVSARTLSQYLRNLGWEQIGTIPHASNVYRDPRNSDLRAVHVPIRDSFADHDEAIAAAVRVIATARQRSEPEVLHDLKQLDSDVVSVLMAQDGPQSVGLQDATALTRHTRRLLAAAGRATKQPRRAFRGPPTSDIDSFLNRLTCEPFDFTEFALTVYSPLTIGTLPGFDDAAFEHRAISTLGEALLSVESALGEANSSDTLDGFDHAVGSGVSANLCGALNALLVHGGNYGNRLDIQIARPKLTAPNGTRSTHVVFSHHDSVVLADAERHLRRRASFNDETLIADVVRLEREPDEFDGRAVLRAPFDNKLRRFDVEFAESDFEVVIRAFRERLPVSVDGDLKPVGRGYLLANPRRVQLHDAEWAE